MDIEEVTSSSPSDSKLDNSPQKNTIESMDVENNGSTSPEIVSEDLKSNETNQSNEDNKLEIKSTEIGELLDSADNELDKLSNSDKDEDQKERDAIEQDISTNIEQENEVKINEEPKEVTENKALINNTKSVPVASAVDEEEDDDVLAVEEQDPMPIDPMDVEPLTTKSENVPLSSEKNDNNYISDDDDVMVVTDSEDDETKPDTTAELLNKPDVIEKELNAADNDSSSNVAIPQASANSPTITPPADSPVPSTSAAALAAENSIKAVVGIDDDVIMLDDDDDDEVPINIPERKSSTVEENITEEKVPESKPKPGE